MTMTRKRGTKITMGQILSLLIVAIGVMIAMSPTMLRVGDFYLKQGFGVLITALVAATLLLSTMEAT